jgi:hypothetical protein
MKYFAPVFAAVLRFHVEVQNVKKQNVEKITGNVEKITGNVEKIIGNVEKITGNVEFI